MKKMEFFVDLKILSDVLSSEYLISSLELIPDRAWNVGDFRPKTKFRERINGVVIGSGIASEAPLENHLAAIVARISPAKDKFTSLAKNCKIFVSIAYYSDFNPSLYFDTDFLRFLMLINAALDVEGYILDSDDDKTSESSDQ